MPNKQKPFPKPTLLVDPIGDPLADVYLFLLRKAAQRKRESAQTLQAPMGAGTPGDVADRTTSDVNPDITTAIAQPEFL